MEVQQQCKSRPHDHDEGRSETESSRWPLGDKVGEVTQTLLCVWRVIKSHVHICVIIYLRRICWQLCLCGKRVLVPFLCAFIRLSRHWLPAFFSFFLLFAKMAILVLAKIPWSLFAILREALSFFGSELFLLLTRRAPRGHAFRDKDEQERGNQTAEVTWDKDQLCNRKWVMTLAKGSRSWR